MRFEDVPIGGRFIMGRKAFEKTSSVGAIMPGNDRGCQLHVPPALGVEYAPSHEPSVNERIAIVEARLDRLHAMLDESIAFHKAEARRRNEDIAFQRAEARRRDEERREQHG